MSWGEVFKINNNMKKALNEQMRDLKFQPLRVITANTTYTPEKTGLYKIICVGAGGKSTTSGNVAYGGGGGGVAIKTMRLEKTSSYNVTVGTTASFGNILTATSGGNASGDGGRGGTASGGDNNFSGENGSSVYNATATSLAKGGSVGVYIGELSRQIVHSYSANDSGYSLFCGDSVLGYGGGAPAGVIFKQSYNTQYVSYNGLPACVIIIPLEMEE